MLARNGTVLHRCDWLVCIAAAAIALSVVEQRHRYTMTLTALEAQAAAAHRVQLRRNILSLATEVAQAAVGHAGDDMAINQMASDDDFGGACSTRVHC